MIKNQDNFVIPQYAISGSQWTKKTFPQIRSKEKKSIEKYFTMKAISLLVKSLRKEMGRIAGTIFFLKYVTIGYLFYKPKWNSDLFDFSSSEQEAYYKKMYKSDFVYFITLYELLKKKYDAKKADDMVSRIIMPLTIHFLGLVFKPDDGCTSANPWWEKGIEYIADIPEYGLEGYVYEAKDHSEVQWYCTKCVIYDIFTAYGLEKTCACSCAGDHIAAHVLYPGIVFERKHCMSVGDSFCDHHAFPKTAEHIGNEDAQFGDCNKIPGLTQIIKSWDDYAKCYWFGSIESWQKFSEKIYDKILRENELKG